MANKYTSVKIHSVLHILKIIKWFDLIRSKCLFFCQNKFLSVTFKNTDTQWQISVIIRWCFVSPLLSDQNQTTLVDTEDKSLPSWIYIKHWSPYFTTSRMMKIDLTHGDLHCHGVLTPYNPHFFLTSLMLTQTDTSKWMQNQHLNQTQVSTSQPIVSTVLRLTNSCGRFPATIPETSLFSLSLLLQKLSWVSLRLVT